MLCSLQMSSHNFATSPKDWFYSPFCNAPKTGLVSTETNLAGEASSLNIKLSHQTSCSEKASLGPLLLRDTRPRTMPVTSHHLPGAREDGTLAELPFNMEARRAHLCSPIVHSTWANLLFHLASVDLEHHPPNQRELSWLPLRHQPLFELT